MVYRKVPTVKVVLSVEARKQVVSLFALLVQIDIRVKPKKRKPPKPKTKENDMTGPQQCGPCFLGCIVYLEMNFLTQLAELHMIDTVVLTLTKDMFEIHNPDLFTPSAQWVLAGVSRSIVSKQNPTKKELTQGIYKPRLTLSYRINAQHKRELYLKIEVSLPKLMFGNNFDELQQKDFTTLAAKLVDVLHEMGVATNATVLAAAPVSTIHYAKNIVLTDGSTPYHYINKIKEANIKLSLDVNQTDYRNDGHSYKWHCNSYEVAFYDKIKDLEVAKVTDKRAVECDNALQLNLLQEFQKRHKLEVLRMEVRLNKRAKIKQLFAKLGLASTLTFKVLFKRVHAQAVLLHYLDELETKRPTLLDYQAPQDKTLLAALFFNNPEMSPKQIMQMYGLKRALEMVTPRELRTMISGKRLRSWQRLLAEAQKVKLPVGQKVFGVIREQVEKFKALKLAGYAKKRSILSAAFSHTSIFQQALL